MQTDTAFWAIIPLSIGFIIYKYFTIVQYKKAHPIGDSIQPTVASVSEACLHWQPSQDLLASPPRPVRVEPATLGMAVFFGLIGSSAFYGMVYVFLLLKTPIRGPAMTAISLSPGVTLAVLIVVAIEFPRRLLRQGEVTGAVITHVSHSLLELDAAGRKRQNELIAPVRYAFLDRNRNLVRGQGKMPPGTQPGQLATVVFDPGRPSRNTLYPLSGFKAGR